MRTPNQESFLPPLSSRELPAEARETQRLQPVHLMAKAKAGPRPNGSQARQAAVRNSISGLVVEYIVAIDVTRVRFPADAFFAWGIDELLLPCNFRIWPGLGQPDSPEFLKGSGAF
jgi:hypothetical protein